MTSTNRIPMKTSQQAAKALRARGLGVAWCFPMLLWSPAARAAPVAGTGPVKAVAEEAGAPATDRDPDPSASNDSDKARARGAFDEGRRAAASGDLLAAVRSFELAYQ